MVHGEFYEPIAISYCENMLNPMVMILKWSLVCCLVIDEQNYVLGALPDDKVSLNDSYGILEVKCSEEYNNRPKRCFLCC